MDDAPGQRPSDARDARGVSREAGLRRFHRERSRSRNRHFEELSSPEARRARRLLRRLDGIERDLRAGGSAELVPHGTGFRITIRFPSLRAARVAFVTAEEHELLVENGRLGRLGLVDHLSNG